MSSVVISGDTSGAITVLAPAVSGTNTLTLQAGTGTNSMNTRGTAVASTSGTSIDFTGLPDWIKRITVMLAGVSTSGTSNFLIQIGAGSVTTSGYVSGAVAAQNGAVSSGAATSTAGFLATAAINTAAGLATGTVTIVNFNSNAWVASSVVAQTDGTRGTVGGGSVTLGGTLDRVRITTVNGTDTFDAGTVNILYEG
jgi:hypothetical protein